MDWADAGLHKKFAVPLWKRRTLFLYCFALSIPLVAQGVDLVGKLCQILIGTALVVLNDTQQALAGTDQPLEHAGGTALPFGCLVLNAHPGALLQTCLLYTSDAADEL